MNPQQAAQQNYLRTKVMTATPEQLQLMLFDGAVRFGEQARVALLAKKWDDSYAAISKVQKIVVEMTSSLKHDVFPELCARLQALYTFAYRKLVEANIEHKVEALDEAMDVLKYQRETWVMLMDKIAKQKAAAAATRLAMPAPSERMEASISMRG